MECEPRARPPARPTEAGIYNFLAGGTHHTEEDRAAARRILEIVPEARFIAVENRRFLGRAVTYLARQGIDQFLDLGSGLPVGGQVHEIAAGVVPEPHVVYIDHDPLVIERSHVLLEGLPHVVAVLGDLRSPRAILDDPDVQRLIDWSRPVAVQCVSTLHFISDQDDPQEIVATFRERMSPGSHLVLSHASGGGNLEAADAARAEWRLTRSRITLRTPAEIGHLFTGFEMVAPGLVTTTEWGTDSAAPTEQAMILCGVGRIA